MAKNVKQEKNSAKSNNSGRQYFNLDDDKAIFEEVDEELRNEKFKQLINKYGGVILSVLVLALAINRLHHYLQQFFQHLHQIQLLEHYYYT